MPTYDYECQSCGHTFEAFQNMSDPPLKRCPKCSKKVKRLIGGGLGIIFKGSGFYSTDNRNGSSSSVSSEKETGKSSPPSETKPKDETTKKSEPAKT